MSWMLGDYIGSASRSLGRSRMRTFLTTLGVAIGVGSVTAILALSGGLTDVINNQLTRISDNIIVARPGTDYTKVDAVSVPTSQQAYVTSTLSEKDIESIKAMPGVAAVAPIMTQAATLKTDTRTMEDTMVVATVPDFVAISQLAIGDGQFLDEHTTDHAAVIGRQLAINLFGTEKPIGLTFTIRGERFTVLGVLKASLDPVNYNRIDFDNAAIVNFEIGKLLNQGRSQIQQIDISAKDVKQIDTVGKQVYTAILANHSNEKDFHVVSGKAVGSSTNDMMQTVAGIMTAIAAISLVVGGVGIMNIMLVGVAERTREIGIRKSVGATSGSIAAQFIIESIMISLLGGLLGYLLGYTVAFAISTFLYFVPSVNWQVAAVAFGMALGVGVLFGFYPALRAARKHPIESLRQYH